MTTPAAGWDAVAAAQDLWGEWQRNSTQEDYIHFLARHLTLARSTAPSADAMREAAATLLDQHRAVIQQATKTANETEAMIYMAQVEYLEETAAIVRALPLPPAQPPAEARMNTDKLAAYYKGIFDHGALKGAGAMREAAAQECFDRQADRHGDHEDAWNEACLHCCERVRALPLPPAQPSAPSTEVARQPTEEDWTDHLACAMWQADSLVARLRPRSVTWEMDSPEGRRFTARAKQVQRLLSVAGLAIRALSPAQPAAVGDEPPAVESVTAEALPSDAALSSIPAAEIEALRKAVGEAIDTFEGKLHSEKIDAILVILGRLQSPTPAGEADHG